MVKRGGFSEPENLDQRVQTTTTPLTAFGLIAVTLMLVFYVLEGRSNSYTLAFAGACLMGSIYGFLQGAWPFGLVEGVWSIVAVRRWWLGWKAH